MGVPQVSRRCPTLRCAFAIFERSFSHLTSPRLPANAIGLLDFCADFIGMEGQRCKGSLTAAEHDPVGAEHQMPHCPDRIRTS